MLESENSVGPTFPFPFEGTWLLRLRTGFLSAGTSLLGTKSSFFTSSFCGTHGKTESTTPTVGDGSRPMTPRPQISVNLDVMRLSLAKRNFGHIFLGSWIPGSPAAKKSLVHPFD